MGPVGRKPADIRLLSVWEFEWYKALHLLRDGVQLPSSGVPTLGLSPEELRTFIERLKRMNAEEYWRTTRRMSAEFGEQVDLKQPPSFVDLSWAERQLADEIAQLEWTLNPPKPHLQVERREVWNELVNARTHAGLQQVCSRWDRLADVRAAGMQCFPTHVLTNEKQFFFMKRNKRFPRSDYGDDSRLEYLARGMAGVMVGVSPMTAIERLRNMKHESGGPFWKEREHWREGKFVEAHCECWRCHVRDGNKLSQTGGVWYANGLRLFMEIADRRGKNEGGDKGARNLRKDS